MHYLCIAYLCDYLPVYLSQCRRGAPSSGSDGGDDGAGHRTPAVADGPRQCQERSRRISGGGQRVEKTL